MNGTDGEDKQVAPKFDPESLIRSVKERIRDTYVSLIPDDQWESMVKKEIHSFFNENISNEYSSNSIRVSTFRKIVWNEMEIAAKEYIKKELDELYSTDWNGFNVQPKQMVLDMCAENSAKILSNMIAGMFQNVINNMRI